MRSLDTGSDDLNGSDTEDADDDSDMEDTTWRSSQGQPQNNKVVQPFNNLLESNTLVLSSSTFTLMLIQRIMHPFPHTLTSFHTKGQQGGNGSSSGANHNGTTKAPISPPSLPGDVLYDTLYRYIVLFANIPSDNDSVEHSTHGTLHSQRDSFLATNDTMQSWYEGNVVWNIVLDSIGLITTASNEKRKNRRTKMSERNRVLRETCVRQFTSDHGTWGMHTGWFTPTLILLPLTRCH